MGAVPAPRARASRRAGVSMVYQELTLAPHLNVEANVLLGLEADPLRHPTPA